jgi:hypothetical protein
MVPHVFEAGHCTKCGIPYSSERAGLPCLAELRMAIAESEVAKRMARDAPIERVSVIDDDGEP